MNTVNQPTLLSTFESGLHEDAELVQTQSVAWAVARGLVRSGREADKLARSQIGRFMALSFHTAEREKLELVAQWTTLFCLLDDQLELDSVGPIELAVYFRDLLAAFRTGSPRLDDVLEGALLDFRASLLRLGNDEWVARFAATLEDLLDAFVWEQINRRKNLRPSLQSYRAMRVETVGLKPVFVLGQLAEGCALSESTRAHPLLHEMEACAARAMGWANDVCTYEKELSAGEVHNLVFVLMDSEGCTLAEAVRRAVAAHDAEIHNLRALSERVPSLGSAHAGLARHALLLQRFVQGHLHWSELTARYRPAVSSFDGAHMVEPATVPELYFEAVHGPTDAGHGAAVALS